MRPQLRLQCTLAVGLRKTSLLHILRMAVEFRNPSVPYIMRMAVGLCKTSVPHIMRMAMGHEHVIYAFAVELQDIYTITVGLIQAHLERWK